MKKILQSIAVCASVMVATSASAQLPDNGIYPGGLELESYTPGAGYSGNHVYTMGTWDVDSILDSGTPVILDLFATWCGPCWNYHNAGTLEALYDSEGWGGNGDVAIFAVEADASTAASKLEGGDAGDWINDTKYPMVNHNSVAGMMNLAYYPTIIMICPDRSVTEVGQTTEAGFTTAMNACAAPASNTNDPRIMSSTTSSNVAICQATTASVPVTVMVQNYSTAAINGSYDIELTDASSAVVGSVTTTLNLAPYAVQEVTIGNVTANTGANTYTAKITTANDDVSNDSYPVSITVSAAATFEVAPNNTVRIELDMDNYASEVGFALVEGIPTGDAAASYAAATSGNSIAYVADGSMANGTTSFSQDYTISDLGCYYFVTYDDYGDGINYQTSGNNARLISSNTLTIDGNWDAGVLTALEFIAGPLSIDEENVTSLSVYPNPATDIANVSLSLNETSAVTITVVNALGQTVYTDNLGNVNGAQNVQINTTDLEEGIYFVNVSVNGTVATERISVIK